MPDPLYLGVWFSTFEADDMLPHALAVMRQFPFSVQKPGITYLTLHPSQVKFLVHGTEFDGGVYEQEGHIQVDLGLDSPFLQEEVPLTIEAAARGRANVQKLVEFTSKVEKNSGANARLLWSESDQNFAQRLITRLHK